MSCPMFNCQNIKTIFMNFSKLFERNVYYFIELYMPQIINYTILNVDFYVFPNSFSSFWWCIQNTYSFWRCISRIHIQVLNAYVRFASNHPVSNVSANYPPTTLFSFPAAHVLMAFLI